LNKKVLILGSTGMLGHQVYNYLKHNSDYRLSNISDREKLVEDTILADIRDENNFIEIIKDIEPDIIVNCIGVLINGANKNPENAVFINTYMPHRLKRLANEIDAKLIHISTDCVFSGDKGIPYLEADFKDGKDIYAKTKGLGEIIDDNNLTLRTSIIGLGLKNHGEDLFHWFMNQSGEINGFTKAIWSGVTTLELVKAIKWSIENNITGLYHIKNNESINKYDLLNLFKKYTNKDIVMNKVDGKEVDKSFMDTRGEINYQIPSYEQMVEEIIDLMKSNKKIYKQYV